MVALHETFSPSGANVAAIGKAYAWAASVDSFSTTNNSRVSTSSSAVRIAWPTTALSTATHYAEATLFASDIGVMVRGDGASDHGYYAKLLSSGTVQIFRWFATFVGSVSIGSTPTLPGVLRVEATTSGSDAVLTVYWNGTQVGSPVTHTGGLLTGTRVGIYTGSTVTGAIDNFRGGDSPATAAAPASTEQFEARNGIDFGVNDARWNNSHGQKINLWKNGGHAIGTNNNTTYVRTSNRFSVFRNGDHDAIENHPGTGGDVLFSVDGSNAEHMNFRMWSERNTVGTVKAAAVAPVIGQQFFETNTRRMLVWDGLAWVYIGGAAQTEEEVTKSSSTAQTGTLGTSASYTPDVIHQAHITFTHGIDVDAAGRAGSVTLKRSIGGGSLSTLVSTRWHDATEAANYEVSLSYFDSGKDWSTSSSVVYQVDFSNDQSSSVTHRAEGHFYIQWIGRV